MFVLVVRDHEIVLLMDILSKSIFPEELRGGLVFMSE